MIDDPAVLKQPLKVNIVGIIVAWDDKARTVIRMSFKGHWSLEEFRAANLQANVMIRSVEHNVYVVADLLQSSETPRGILWQLREIAGMRAANWGGGIALTHSAIIKTLVDVLRRIYMGSHGTRVFVAHTNEEARDMIARMKAEDQQG